jgi:tetratricopeptide (TPR) repeat protein
MINKVNSYTMKAKAILFLATLSLTIGGVVNAQAPDDCNITLSLFAEPAKAKNYEAALPHYEKVIAECPKFSLATYQYAERMFKYFIDKGDKSKVNDLIKSYNLRLDNFPTKTKEGDILSDIAQVKFDNGIGSKMEQFNAFDLAFKKDAENFTSPKSLYTYFSLAVDLYNSGEMDLQDVFDLYDVVFAKIEKEESDLAAKLTQLLDKQDSGATLTSKESKYLKAYETNLESYGKVKGSVDAKLGQLADCPNLIPLYNKDFEAKKTDITWVRRAAGRLSAKDCDDPLFFKLVQELHKLEPSAKSAYYLGKLAEKDGNASQALEYYNQAAELETNPSDKARVYYSIAENFRKKGSSGQARSYYMKMVEVKPSAGIAYLKISNMYAASANNCGSSTFEKRAIYWKAAEMARKAARVDGSIAGSANATADSYEQRAPSKSDIFSEGMAGKTISFNCWVGGSVRVPNL